MILENLFVALLSPSRSFALNSALSRFVLLMRALENAKFDRGNDEEKGEKETEGGKEIIV